MEMKELFDANKKVKPVCDVMMGKRMMLAKGTPTRIRGYREEDDNVSIETNSKRYPIVSVPGRILVEA